MPCCIGSSAGARTGEIWAELADYAAVRPLMVDAMSEGAELKQRQTVPETVAAVKELEQTNHRDGHSKAEIAERLNLDRSAAKRRLDHAIKAGLIALVETRTGRAFLYATTDAEMAADATLLPTVDQVEETYRTRRAQISRRDPPDSRAQLAHLRLSR